LKIQKKDMKNLHHSKLAFIGGGKMAEAIIKGLLSSKAAVPSQIMVYDKDKKRIKHLVSSYNIKGAASNPALVAAARIVILAVKPQDMLKVLDEISPYASKHQMFISIAAGVTIGALQKKLKKVPLLRAMPNSPAMVGCGITALSHGQFAAEGDLKLAELVFSTVGETLFVPEEYMDAVTALSGSGPAFAYLFLEGLIDGAIRSNLPPLTARRLALAMIKGALCMVEKTEHHLSALRDMVTSKGGTTEAGLKVLKKYKFKKAVEETLLAAARRSKELSK